MDLNFFDEYIDSKLNHFKKVLLFFFTLIIILLLLAIRNVVLIHNLNDEIDTKISLIENPESNKKLMEAQELGKELRNNHKELENLTDLDEKMNTLNILTDEIIEDIYDCTFNEFILSSISYYENVIELYGTAESPNQVAEYSKNIEKMDDINEVFISHISFNEINYNYSMNLYLEGDEIDGWNQNY